MIINHKNSNDCPILYYDLQFFADKDSKTEKPTPRKREKAREEGQVAKSMEINTAFLLIFMFAGLKIFASFMYKRITSVFKNTYMLFPQLDDLFNVSSMLKFASDIFTQTLIIVAPLFAISMVVGFSVNFAQVGWHPTLKPLKPNFDRLNPIKGFSRLFSKQALIELLKSIGKIAIIAVIIYNCIVDEMENLLLLLDMELMPFIIYIGSLLINIGLKVGLFFIFVAAADYFFQRYEFEQNLKMTKEEVKEEYKMTEGDPQVKSKIRQKMREVSLRRVIKDIPKADVIITNPTHYAVALQYDSSVHSAPVVIAKGVDYLAMRIKNIAKENNIEIVENKVLARTLYQTVEIGEEIPPELYQAVAEILAFVYSLRHSY